ncbi:hypothetical protein [Rhizobacter sp. Root16D2]|uniref:hypothetical protein n=1 Tax=Rhizobacter sp. Root16D2 TaxID=1736479 RepID=UPI000AFDF593|nr:hypothetical protein [Rhizobacter sp. Root16D2]
MAADSTEFDGVAAVNAAIASMDATAKRHYGLEHGLADLLVELNGPLARRQYARLLGVMVKAPFSEERRRRPAASTKAVYGMDWKDTEALRLAGPGHWQLEFLRALVSDEGGVPIDQIDPYASLVHYKYESSLGKFIFRAFRKRICGNAATSASIKEAIRAARKSGIKLVEPTSSSISVGIASTVAVAVASVLPATIAAVGAPVVGGIALLLVQVGVEGFCEWSAQAIEEEDANQREEAQG